MTWFQTLPRTEDLTLSVLVTPLILTVTLVFVMSSWLKRHKMASMLNKIPGPKAYPIIGNGLEVCNVSPRVLFAKIVSFCDYGVNVGRQVSRVWIGMNGYLFIFKANAVEVILSSQKFIDKSFDYKFLHPWLGTGLLTATGQKWHSRRKMLTPAFHFKILEEFVEVFNRQSATLVDKISQHCGTKKTFDVFPFITMCTLDIISESAMGVRLNVQNNGDSEYVKAVSKIAALIQIRTARPWLQFDILFKLFGYAKQHDACLKILHDTSYTAIRDRRQERKEQEGKEQKNSADEESNEPRVMGQKKRLAFLDLLLDMAEKEGNQLTDEDIREEVDTFMFEGHDTTAAAISWSLYLIGCDEQIQAKVFEELESIFGDSDRAAEMADLREMKYLECCIKEALRIFPSVPFIARELMEDVTIDGYQVPAGTTAMIINYRLHRDPDYFPDPEIFDPDRFLPENSATRHPFSYVPFSAGPRNCIGQKFALMEEKIVLSSILRQYKVESVVRREDLKILGELILRPEDGIFIQIQPRK